MCSREDPATFCDEESGVFAFWIFVELQARGHEKIKIANCKFDDDGQIFE